MGLDRLSFIFVLLLTFSFMLCVQPTYAIADTSTSSQNIPAATENDSEEEEDDEEENDDEEDVDDGETDAQEDSDEATTQAQKPSRTPTEEEIRRIDDNFVSEDLEPNSPHVVVTPPKDSNPKVQFVNDEEIARARTEKRVSEEKLPPNKVNVVVLRALDKISGKAQQLKIPVGEIGSFRRLRILAHACKASKPTEAPEATAFLKIYEEMPDTDEKSKLHYSGWMFASSPTVGALTHPVYDVWIESCETLDKKDLPEEDAGEVGSNK